VAKVVSAKEKISDAGNDMIVMRLSIPDGRTIGSVLTFVPQAQPVINAFCDSAELRKPAQADVAVELTTRDCLGRYVYIAVTVETDNRTGAAAKVTRFLRREEALLLNPELARVAIRDQVPVELRRTQPNLFNS
jgi:hypothetical protein